MKAWSHGAAAQHKETQIHSRRVTLPVKPNYIIVLVITDTEHRSWFVVRVHQKVGHTGRMKGRRVAAGQHVDCLRAVTLSLRVFKFHTRRKPRAFTSTPPRLLPPDKPQEVNAQTERWSSSRHGCCPSRPLWETGPWPSAPGRTRTPSPGTQLGGDERHDHGPRARVPNLEEDTKPMWQLGRGGVDWGEGRGKRPPTTPAQRPSLTRCWQETTTTKRGLPLRAPVPAGGTVADCQTRRGRRYLSSLRQTRAGNAVQCCAVLADQQGCTCKPCLSSGTGPSAVDFQGAAYWCCWVKLQIAERN